MNFRSFLERVPRCNERLLDRPGGPYDRIARLEARVKELADAQFRERVSDITVIEAIAAAEARAATAEDAACRAVAAAEARAATAEDAASRAAETVAAAEARAAFEKRNFNQALADSEERARQLNNRVKLLEDMLKNEAGTCKSLRRKLSDLESRLQRHLPDNPQPRVADLENLVNRLRASLADTQAKLDSYKKRRSEDEIERVTAEICSYMAHYGDFEPFNCSFPVLRSLAQACTSDARKRRKAMEQMKEPLQYIDVDRPMNISNLIVSSHQAGKSPLNFM